jgi:hypothetical protein
MQIEPEQPLVLPGQRLVPKAPSSDGSARIVLLLAGAIILAVLGFTFSDRVTRAFYALEEASGLAPSQQQFAATYRQLGISVLPLRLFAKDDVANSLTRLTHEACDHQAIRSLANALAAEGKQLVGWAERGDTHQSQFREVDGFREGLNPSYAPARAGRE